MVIVKSEWLNLRSLVTATAVLPVLEYLYHLVILAIAHWPVEREGHRT